MIEKQLPEYIASSNSHNNETEINVHPDELRAVINVSSLRASDYLNGRKCAHLALKKLGFQYSHAILSGIHRDPLWPANIVGSITHCAGYCAAAVAYSKDVNGIGIDVEVNKPLSKSLIPLTLTENELRRYATLNINDYCIYKLIFSAKESFFKFLYPKIQCYINFKDVEINLNIKSQSFTGQILDLKLAGSVNISSMAGHFQFNHSHIVTTIYCST